MSAFIYEQANGNLWYGLTLLGTGYAGAPSGKNHPAMENVPNIGPLPQGWYTIGAPTDSTHCGQEAMPLRPDAANEMFGRAGFFMHGDDRAHPGDGSDGCIVQARPVRDAVVKFVEAGNNRLQVVAFMPVVTDQEIE